MIAAVVAAMQVAGSFVHPTDLLAEGWFLGRADAKLRNLEPIWHDQAIDSVIDRVRTRLEGDEYPRGLVEIDVAACGASVGAVSPGGYVRLCLPLLQMLETEDELAFLIAHEMAHLVLNHTVTGDGTYSLERETNADLLGAVLASSAGYAPEGAILFLEKIAALGGADDRHAAEARLSAMEAEVEGELAPYDHHPFTPFGAAWAAASARARGRSVRTEEIYDAYLDGLAAGMAAGGSGAPADRARSAACTEVYERLSEAAEREADALLFQQVVTITDTCNFYVGAQEAFTAYVADHVDFASAQPATLAAVIASSNMLLDQTLMHRAVGELGRRAGTGAQDLGVALQHEEKVLFAEDAAAATLVWTCEVVGRANSAAAFDRLRRLLRADVRTLKGRLGGGEKARRAIQACEESIDAAALETQTFRDSVEQTRLDMGHDPGVARMIAQKSAATEAMAHYLADPNALRRVIVDRFMDEDDAR